jgi:type III secretion protein L
MSASYPRQPGSIVVPAEQVETWRDVAALQRQLKALLDGAVAAQEQACSEAREAGRQQGLQAGRDEAAALLLRTRADVGRYLDGVRPQMIELVMDAVRHVLGRHEPADLVASMFGQALAAFKQGQALTLWLGAAAGSELGERLETQAAEAGVALSVRTDPALAGYRGVLTGPDGTLDIGLECQLERLQSLFQHAMPDALREPAA